MLLMRQIQFVIPACFQPESSPTPSSSKGTISMKNCPWVSPKKAALSFIAFGQSAPWSFLEGLRPLGQSTGAYRLS
jgi:hypothetical protein